MNAIGSKKCWQIIAGIVLSTAVCCGDEKPAAKTITDKIERKKVKRTARKKATPKPKRTYARGSQNKKVKKLARGQSKR